MRPEKNGVPNAPPPDDALITAAPQSSAGPRVTWRVIRVLGVGGMARVSLAEQWRGGRLERLVALKRMHEHLAENAEFVRMFFDESRLASAVQHPNVVRVLEVHARADERFLVMEYVEGYSLARIMQHFAAQGRRMPLSFAIRIVVDTLRGLHAAHEARDAEGAPLGIIHRDVAPQNVLVSVGGVARITDFGVARAAGRLSETAPGLVKGHLAYVAPEAVSGAEVTHRADVFAAGVILWELLSGQRLMAADTHVETLRNVAVRPIPAPIDTAPLLAAVCARALDRDPMRRYPTARAFAAALEEAATHLGVSLLRGGATAVLRELHEAGLATEQPAPVSGVAARAPGTVQLRSGSYARPDDPTRISATLVDVPPPPRPSISDEPTRTFTRRAQPGPVETPSTLSAAGSAEPERRPGAPRLPTLELASRHGALRNRPLWMYAMAVFALVGLGYTLRVAVGLLWHLARH
jgi:serine/threonine protein kinase